MNLAGPLVLLLMLLAGCGNPLFHKTEAVPNRIWETEHNMRFDVLVEDTMGSYDFYIDLRNDGSYPFSNIFMFVNTTFPSGKTARDTVECILADPSGRWLGKGIGDIWDNHILFKENVRFPNAGSYTFEFEQGMREPELKGVLDVGICIEPHKSK
jgi:gliding motility-associated lipoprotein GldH